MYNIVIRVRLYHVITNAGDTNYGTLYLRYTTIRPQFLGPTALCVVPEICQIRTHQPPWLMALSYNVHCRRVQSVHDVCIVAEKMAIIEVYPRHTHTPSSSPHAREPFATGYITVSAVVFCRRHFTFRMTCVYFPISVEQVRENFQISIELFISCGTVAQQTPAGSCVAVGPLSSPLILCNRQTIEWHAKHANGMSHLMP